MTRPPKTAVQIQEMKDRILDTALGILEDQGHQAITSRAIAEKMGVAHMSLFTYFTNQAAILRVLRERELSKWRTRALSFIQSTDSTTISEVVERYLRSYIDFAREHPELYKLAWVMPELGIESAEESLQRMRSNVEQLAGLLHRGIGSGVFAPRDPAVTAGTALAMVNTPYTLFHSGKLVDPVMRDHMAEEVLSIIMNYLIQKN